MTCTILRSRVGFAAGCLSLVTIVGIVLYLVARNGALELRDHGVWGRGVIVDIINVRSRMGRSGRGAIYYMIEPPDEYITNWIVETDTHHLGDTIAVLFVPSNPSNRVEFNADRTPLRYLRAGRRLK